MVITGQEFRPFRNRSKQKVLIKTSEITMKLDWEKYQIEISAPNRPRSAFFCRLYLFRALIWFVQTINNHKEFMGDKNLIWKRLHHLIHKTWLL